MKNLPRIHTGPAASRPGRRAAALRAGVLACVVAFAVAACASYPAKPAGADALRARLTQLQSDPQLGKRAPLAMQDADTAVSAAEQPQAEASTGAHLVFLADRRIAIARAMAQVQLAVDQRKELAERRGEMRLAERTNEADRANDRARLAQSQSALDQRQAEVATMDANAARTDADAARMETDVAHGQANAARAETAAAQDDANVARGESAQAQSDASAARQELADMQARPTDRGLVVTLGDVLFAFGTADINAGGSDHLNKLATFLVAHPSRTALVEGYTDNQGSADYNMGLSQRRADAVKSFLVSQGVLATRLAASGKGKSAPVGDNRSSTGRQQNRRVEVVISNDLVSARQ